MNTETDEKDFVYIDEYGLLGSNFYRANRHKTDATDEELRAVGLTDSRVRVHKDIVNILVDIDKKFQEKGYRLYIKEGYRSKKLYELVYKKRVERFGKERTDRLINMKDMPHSTGKTVDVALWDPKENKEIFLRNGADGDDAYFINFYKNKKDEQSRRFQELQDFVINTLQDYGFRVGVKGEYFHFNYRPEEPKNYVVKNS